MQRSRHQSDETFAQGACDLLRGVRCPEHHQAPRLHFHGVSLDEITISLSGCCARLMELANAQIALAEPVREDLRKPA
jgi:hypothetical protein